MKQVVAVKFELNNGNFSDNEYHYFSLEDVKVDDYVAVGTQYGYKIAKVTNVLMDSSHAKQYVIQRIDFSKHEEAMERQVRATELKKRIEAERRKHAEIEEYKAFAERNPDNEELTKLVEEYLSLQ